MENRVGDNVPGSKRTSGIALCCQDICGSCRLNQGFSRMMGLCVEEMTSSAMISV